jgi:quercetin dioxygenase-like cupin family protein
MEDSKIDFESLPWQSPAPGVRFKAHEQGGRRVRLAEFAREFVEPDWCTKGHIGYILDGQVEIDFDGRVVAFSAGDGLFIPPGQDCRHKAHVLTDVVRLIMVEDV